MGWTGTQNSTDLTPDVWQTLCITNTTGRVQVMYVNGVADGGGTFGGGGGDDIGGIAPVAENRSNDGNSPYRPGDSWIIDCVVYDDSTVGSSDILGWSNKIRGMSYSYPDLEAGTTFQTSDTNQTWIWDGTDTWSLVA